MPFCSRSVRRGQHTTDQVMSWLTAVAVESDDHATTTRFCHPQVEVERSLSPAKTSVVLHVSRHCFVNFMAILLSH